MGYSVFQKRRKRISMKTKSKLILSILFLIPFFSKAKDSDSTLKSKNQRIEVGFSLGCLLPIGDYASKTGNNPACATIGGENTFSLTYRFSKFIGVGIEAGIFDNYANNGYFISRLGQIPNDNTQVSGYPQWMGSYYSAGIRLYYPIKKILFRAGINAGRMNINEPGISYNWGTSSTTSSTDGDFRINNSHCYSNNAEAACYKFSLNACYYLNKRFDFIAQVSYLYAKPDINQTTETYIYSNPVVVSPNITSYGNVSQNINQTSFLQPVSNIGLSLGVIIKLL